MIVSKTPLRISFVGGGSDFYNYYSQFGGAVVTSSIDKFIYVTLNTKFDHGIRLSYSKTENVNSSNDIEHNLVKKCLNYFSIMDGIELTTIADIPSKGSGLGSSSSFSISLIHCILNYLKKDISKKKLAELACMLEIELCKEPIGKQDQYAAAYGGINLIEFKKNDDICVTNLAPNDKYLDNLQSELCLFYTGITREASSILTSQNEDIKKDDLKQKALKKMVSLSYELCNVIKSENIQDFGNLLHENWILKKSLNNSISNSFIDEAYSFAMENGALGGKILGAGAGGFFLFHIPKEYQNKIIKMFEGKLRYIPFQFDFKGSVSYKI